MIIFLKVLKCSSVGGATVSMVAFQAVDPGSTPGRRTRIFLLAIKTHNIHILQDIQQTYERSLKECTIQ